VQVTQVLRVVMAAAAAAAALCAAAAPAVGATPLRALPDCLGHAQVRPKQVVFACADGNFYVDRLDWVGWGGARAVGLGTVHLNDCEPYCAAGHFHTYSAVLIASGSQRCPDGEPAYLTVTWAFVGRSPYPPSSSGTLNPRQNFRCKPLR
jgi:hypothetical protein